MFLKISTIDDVQDGTMSENVGDCGRAIPNIHPAPKHKALNKSAVAPNKKFLLELSASGLSARS